MPCHQRDRLHWFSSHVPPHLEADIRTWDAGERLFQFLANRTRRETRDHIERYLRGDQFNITYLASGIRHVFAHGLLTPDAATADPNDVVRICDGLAPAHLEGMGKDFGAGI